MSQVPAQNSVFKEELERLNPVQREAVEHIEGPVLVIAGPGTGKTQILSARIGNILLQTDTPPHSILCLTYTDAGTIAMRKRLLRFIGPDAYRVHIYTFHAFCNQLIQDNLEIFGYRDLRPLSELESLEMYHKLIDQLPADSPLKRYTGDIYYDTYRLQALYSTMKKEAWTPDFLKEKTLEFLEEIKYSEEYQYKRANKTKGIKQGDLNMTKFNATKEKMEKLLAALTGYNFVKQEMTKTRRYDYHDMILWVLEAFRRHPAFLTRYQEQYQYFLVDEYQDTNGAQNEILNALTNYWEAPNVFVVGDDDQAIYRFQGASISNIVDFYDRHQEHVRVFLMKENYRSTQAILDAAGSLIKNNKERLVNKIEGLDKTLLSANLDLQGLTSTPNISEYFNVYHEEAAVCNKIINLAMAGEDLGEIAVIYRNHRQVASMVKFLESKNIPLNIRQKVNILELPLVRNIINLLTYVWEEYEKTDSSEALLYEVMHYAFFKINPRDIAVINRHCRKRDVRKEGWRSVLASRETLFQLQLLTASRISEFEENISYWISQVPNCTVQILFEKILTRGGLLSWIMQSDDKVWNLQVVTTLFDFIKDETAKNEFRTLGDVLGTLALMTSNNIPLPLNRVVISENGLNFVTAHSSKGLEYKKVFLIGCNADTWDKSRAGNAFRLPDNLVREEEAEVTEDGRRLFYVAMTRAREELFISYAAHKANEKEDEASRYVAELVDSSLITLTRESVSDVQLLEYQLATMLEFNKAEIDFLDEGFLKEELKGYSMSVTHLNKYLRCPIAFYFENVLKVPSARNESIGFGSAVHHALYHLFHNMQNDVQKEFVGLNLFLRYFDDGMKFYHSHFTKEDYDRRTEYGHKILSDYYRTYADRWNKQVKTELRVSNCEVDGVPVNGAIDKMEIEGKQVNVIDYKTGKPANGKKKLNPPSEKDPTGGDYWRQIVFYKLLLDNDKSSNYAMVSGEIDFVEPDTSGEYVKKKVVVSPEDISLVKAQIKDTYQKILALDFRTGCGKEDCAWCNFVRHNYNSSFLVNQIDNEE